ncbi:DNA polymerase protein [Methylophilales phage Melnitz EXVC044M]|nr:DNA polymerase [Methylophilales phage Melnitz-1 EXVC043M]QZI94731.1 DNA polymerase protein [Methylophilales phage Melnitz-2 EXVC040M]QZI94953.1 DNA polymerase protein [Methylophilales phage Melnitz EXVC044M]QZI95174.1 DNA polymerase protein [Methylophilales phage Melnitz-3 EXVC039M]
MNDVMLWVEKYRPSKISECILTDDLKKTFQTFVDEGNIPNLLLTGGPGVGKTTVAKAMLEELGATYMMINGSEESGIDVLRNKIKNFASTVSMDGNRKFVILDEADYLNPQSTQPALRGFIEEFHKNCGFILTCNFKNRIIDPLHSRCSVVEFRIPVAEKPKLAGEFFKRVQNILGEEGVQYQPKAVAGIVEKYFPDWRRVLNELQRYSVSGMIDSGILVNISETNMKDLTTFLKEKDFKSIRKWVANNLDNDPARAYRKVYDALYEDIQPQTVPHLVLATADYSYKSAFVADQEINMLAFMIEIMTQVQFK